MHEPVPAPSQNAGALSDSRAAGASSTDRSRPGLVDALGALAGFIGLSLLLSILLATLLGDGGLSTSEQATTAIIATPIAWLSLGGWAVWVSVRRGGGPGRDYAWAFSAWDLPIGLGGLMVVLLAGGIYAVTYQQITGELPNSAVGITAEGASTTWQLVSLSAMALGAAVVEEVHFRGLWWRALRRHRWPQGAVLVVTSVIFALFHLEPARVPLLFVIGLVVGGVRMVTGRLGTAIVTHLMVNLIGSIGLLTMM